MDSPLIHILPLLQVSQEGIGAFDFSAETMNKLTAPLAADVAAPVAADLAVPLSGPAAAMQPASRAIHQPGGGGMGASSGVQVFAAVAKDASEQELRQLFSSVPGLEQCRLLPHQQTGMFEVGFYFIISTASSNIKVKYFQQ